MTKIVIVLALKLEMELIRGIYDRERTLNSYKDEGVGDMKSVDISEGCKYRYFIRSWYNFACGYVILYKDKKNSCFDFIVFG